MLESLLISYFLGAIPFSYIFTKSLCGKDITKLGSKNVGTSNAVYSCGMKVGLLCLIGDFFKGYFAYLIASGLFGLSGWALVITSVAVVAGHNWSIFLKFKGGKGIATTWGVLCASNPLAGLLGALFMLVITLFTKYMAMGTVLACVFVFLISLVPFFNFNALLILMLLLTILPKHYENYLRIRNGTEIKINERLKE
jgi:glycerol-3-phosphate acyltransferase PlsY